MQDIKIVFDTLYNKIMERPNKILEIFNNFFGEERVDMQEFPSVGTFLQVMYNVPIFRIFDMADMESKLPLLKLDKKEVLRNIQWSSIPGESSDMIKKALLSEKLISNLSRSYNGFILVHFPRTTVTNEYDKSTVVNHIYIKVPISANGTESGSFSMNRSEYTVAELYSNYMHSHAQNIPTDNFSCFVHCCLGSGPLVNTQLNLSIAYDEDIWNLFCLELSKYIETESVAGTPYHRLESINFNTLKMRGLDRLMIHGERLFYNVDAVTGELKKVLKDFLYYYLENNDLTYSYRNGVYSIGIPFTEYLINISNSFIEWVNKQPELKKLKNNFNRIIRDYSIRNGELYCKESNTDTYINTYREYIGRRVCTFKGRPVVISISDIDRMGNNNYSDIKVIDINFASHLLTKILITINYRYGRNQESPYSTAGKVKYKI